MSHSRPYQVTQSRIDWSCRWYSVRKDDLIQPDGRPGEYNIVTKPDAALIVPITPANEIIMLYHYRHSIDRWCWEIPAGGIEAHQTPEEAAKAELAQEIGGVTDRWAHIGSFNTAVSFCDELCELFIARDVELGQTAHEPMEIMEIHTWPIEKALEFARSGQMKDALSALALLIAEPHLRK